MSGFNAQDPVHALVNPLRARRDKPHIWFQEGYWRVSPTPLRKAGTVKSMRARKLWIQAHRAIGDANDAMLGAC